MKKDKSMDEEEIRKRLSSRESEYLMFTDDDIDRPPQEPPVSAEKSNDGDIVIFKNYEIIKKSIEKLRTELSMLMSERDELKYVICENIEAAYYLKFGALEYKVYEAQCAALRLKRKIQLIQAKINRQEQVDINLIETRLDEEFEQYQEKLDEQINKMNEALERNNADCLSDDDAKELKKLYRNVVKQLHPDVNPNVSDAEIRLLENAVIAYKAGNLAELRIINEMVGGHTPLDDNIDAMSYLLKEKERLSLILKSIRNGIAEIKSKYPYNVKEYVENPEKEKAKKQELESALQQYTEMYDGYKARLSEMLG